MATARKRGSARTSRLPVLRDRLGGWLRGGGWHRPLLGLLLSVAMAFLMADYQFTPLVKLSLGEIAERDVLAWTDFKVPNFPLTNEAQRAAENETRPVFVHDEVVVEELLRRVDRGFIGLHASLGEHTAAAQPPEEAAGDGEEGGGAGAAVETDPAVLDQAIATFESVLGVTLTETDRSTVLRRGGDERLRDMVMTLVERSMSRMIIGDASELPADERAGISLIHVRGADRDEEALYEFGDLVTLQQARMEVSMLAAELYPQQLPFVRSCTVDIAGSMVRPNVTLDASETRVRREAARATVGVVYEEFKEGQVIVRKGEMVTQDHLDALEEMEKHRGGYRLWLNVSALSAMVLLLIVATYLFATRFIRKYARKRKDLMAQAALAVLAVALCRIGEMVAGALSEAFPAIPEESYYLVMPVAATVVMVRILMNSETALVFATVVVVACSYVLGGDLLLMAYFLVGSVAGAGALAHAKERGKVFRAGMVAALVNVLFVLAATAIRFSLFGGGLEEGSTKPLFDVMFAVLCGVGVGVIALGLIPVFEAAGFITDIKLLELASLDHPLMRDMVIKAPGTYHHSVLVGSLAEAAAEAISANALLARVGSYFHDIGKTLKTQYYVENQSGPTNLHDRLSPPMSALIIINHVKEGIELGREHRLPKEILDIIPQHHGTSLIRYFYEKARQAADVEKATVNEEDYRYPGPKPQTREAGIVMLADGVEAATRSLKEPTRHNIEARVQKVINAVVIDGQLDQCPLTLKDLSIVAETFCSVLTGIHHHRIEYPDAEDEKPAQGEAPTLSPPSTTDEVVRKDAARPGKKARASGGNGSGDGNGKKGKTRGKDAGRRSSSGKAGKGLTLELPPMQSTPGMPHPLDKEARARAERALRNSEPGTAAGGTDVADITRSSDGEDDAGERDGRGGDGGRSGGE